MFNPENKLLEKPLGRGCWARQSRWPPDGAQQVSSSLMGHIASLPQGTP